jgi:hypothetical protein
MHMVKRTPKYPKEEIARRGGELYENQIRTLVWPLHIGKMVAIDIDTGNFEVADNTLDACQALIDRNPQAQIWCIRIGHRAAASLGFHGTTEEP